MARSGGGPATSSQGCLDVVDDITHVLHSPSTGGLVEALAETADVDDADQRARLAEDAHRDAGKTLLELVDGGRISPRADLLELLAKRASSRDGVWRQRRQGVAQQAFEATVSTPRRRAGCLRFVGGTWAVSQCSSVRSPLGTTRPRLVQRNLNALGTYLQRSADPMCRVRIEQRSAGSSPKRHEDLSRAAGRAAVGWSHRACRSCAGDGSRRCARTARAGRRSPRWRGHGPRVSRSRTRGP